MDIKTVHINSDVGEGIGNEAQLLPYISACNIACGAHAGNDALIQEVIALAITHNVQIGAHPGYPDPEHFGRRQLAISDHELQQSVTTQIQTIQHYATQAGTKLMHVKTHGALYNLAAKDAHYADLVLETVLNIDPNLILYVPYNSVLASKAKGIIPYKLEGFADRQYEEDYSLVSRSLDGAVLTTNETVYNQVQNIINEHLISRSGKKLQFEADTICFHGDTTNATHLLAYVSSRFKDDHIVLER